MLLFPKDIKEKVEYQKVIERIQSECLSFESVKYFDELKIETDLKLIERLLKETEEYRKSIERGESLPLSHFENILQDVVLLRKEGYVLDIEAIQRFHLILSIAMELKKYFLDIEKVKFNPLIHQIVEAIILDHTLVAEIERVLDVEGNIKPDASPELLKISKQIKSKERECDKVFNQELEFYKAKNHLSDSYESLRNGRRVLTVGIEYRKRVPGVIHDESATGKTVFIEPEKVLALNTEIYNLYAERRAEIYKIIRTLCAFLRPYSDLLVSLQHILVKLDTIRAKAKYAHTIGAKRPNVQHNACFQIKTAYNPILLQKNMNTSEIVVPFTLELLGKNRILILSGPNAGGKSVVMKSVGLLQMMVQSGILVPVDENSVFGIFEKIFVDIGDQQSLEDDLSTYSSHLQNMRYTSEQADKKSLVLIDEFGAGTDPKIGGAIAEAILFHLFNRKCFGVITTHYSNLKFFAFKMHGIVNGSMEFDKHRLIPTYQLHIGKPGSSFAFEIAQKIGLDEKIIQYAQQKTGKNEKAIDDMLITLMDEKREYEQKFESLIEKQDRLDKLIRSYEHMNAELEVKKKKIKLEAKESASIQLHSQNQEVQKLLKEIKKTKDEEKAKIVVEKLKVQQTEMNQQLASLKEEVFVQQAETSQEPITIGSFVRMRSGSAIGEVINITKKTAIVQMGIMQLTIPLVELEYTKEPLDINKKRSVNTDQVVRQQQSDTKIDLREYTKSDALDMLQDFLDRALLHNAFELKIIHGVGTGVMKKEVWKKLREYKDIKKMWHPEFEQGGDGVTLVQF